MERLGGTQYVALCVNAALSHRLTTIYVGSKDDKDFGIAEYTRESTVAYVWSTSVILRHDMTGLSCI